MRCNCWISQSFGNIYLGCTLFEISLMRCLSVVVGGFVCLITCIVFFLSLFAGDVVEAVRRCFEWFWREEEKSIEAGRQCFSAKGQCSQLTLLTQDKDSSSGRVSVRGGTSLNVGRRHLCCDCETSLVWPAWLRLSPRAIVITLAVCYLLYYYSNPCQTKSTSTTIQLFTVLSIKLLKKITYFMS